MKTRQYLFMGTDILRLPPRWVLWIIAWMIWIIWAWCRLPTPLPFPEALTHASPSLPIEGWVHSFPRRGRRTVRFEYVIDVPPSTPAAVFNGQQVRLSWWDSKADVRIGDRFAFTVRLKPPHGLKNPGAFDYERWLIANGIVATGTIRAQPPPRLLIRADRYPIDRLRQRIAESFTQQLPDNLHVGVLIALSVGEAGSLSAWQWDVFNRTGVGHLISVSGTHISFVTGITWGFLWLLLRITAILAPGFTMRWPIARVAAVCALIVAGGYTVFSGWSVPAQRAFFMAALVMLSLWSQRPIVPRRLLPFALLIVIILDPAAFLTVGFWLSFGAVAVILYMASGRQHAVWWMALLRVQILLSVALVPLTLVFFQRIPLLSPVANLIAIPWVDCTVLPLSLLAALATPFPMIQAPLLQLAAFTMDGLWQVLLLLDQLPNTVLYWPAPPLWTLVFMVIGLLLLLAPRGLPGRWLWIPLSLPLLWPPLHIPPIGAVWFTLLDVGEGLSAVVRTRTHVLVYDTGPKIGDTLDAGRAAIVPFLRQQGFSRVDMLIVNHNDGQHTGGVRSLRENMPVQEIRTSDPVQIPIDGAQPCRAGQEWVWDAVRFRVLHPPDAGFSGNNASCVLQVENAAGRVLLTGDIEVAAEVALVAMGVPLAAEILVAPHHGRRNLSTSIFLAAVSPRYVLLSTDADNRYGYPRPDTVARYQSTGATVLNTADEGAITFRMEPNLPLIPEWYRRGQ